MCHLCGVGRICLIESFAALRRVSSDCKPWPAGGTLGCCQLCGGVQKAVDDNWLKDSETVYTGYSIYHQSDGVEQSVFNAADGSALSRSGRIVDRLVNAIPLPASGRLLDVGCGNGATLRAYSRLGPCWSMSGTELHDKYRAVVEQIPQVEALYTCPIEEIPGEFDFISLVHVLEHVPEPLPFLNVLRRKLRPGGLLFVEVPDHTQNPFDLVIVDHATHFSPDTLRRLAFAARLDVVALAANWVQKELSLTMRNVAPLEPQASTNRTGAAEAARTADAAVAWLHAVLARGRSLRRRNIGLFGTSIGAMWLLGDLEERVGFFVDEDPHRVGRTVMGLPVYRPEDAPADAELYLPMPRPIAEAVYNRLSSRIPAPIVLPPEMSW